MKGSRIKGIWDEFIAKVIRSFETETDFGPIVNKFCRSFSVNLRTSRIISQILNMDISAQHELFDYTRENIQIVIHEIYSEKKEKKNENEKAKN